MDKKKLMQYRALVREIPKLAKDINKLYERLDEVPVVSGKVTGSSKDFPYTEVRTTVQMVEPKAAAEIRKQISIKERRRDNVEQEKTDIEKFIADISDSTDRLIFDYAFLNEKRMSQSKIGEAVGCDQSTVSRTIKKYLKDA